MKKITKYVSFACAACLLSSALLALSACDGGSAPAETSTEAVTQATTEAQELAYTVTVADYAGNPMKDVVVSVLKDGQEVKTNVVKAEGKATFKLPEGDYSFTLSAPKGAYYYDTNACKLSPASPDASVTLYQTAENTMTLWAPSPLDENGKEQEAFVVGDGATHCEPVGGGEMTYFVFAPAKGGVYEVSFMADGQVDLGYYGMPINVFATKLLDTVDGKVTVEVREDSVNLSNPEQTCQLVFGVLPEAATTTDLIFTVKRTGDVPKRPEDEPWIEYQSTQAKAFEGEHGTTLTDIDVTKPDLTVVYNESDGYYHYGAADGPVVFIRLTSPSPYMEPLAGVVDYQRLGVYIYDENGAFVRKESYHEMLEAYKAVCDTNGVCPLTPELEYMVKRFGDKQGWWNFSAGIDIFRDKIVPQDTAWLFLCCYYN